MTTTPEGLTIVGPEDVYTHEQVWRFLRGRRRHLQEEVASNVVVELTERTFSSCVYGTPIRIFLSTRQSATFRYLPWSAALHEWGHAVEMHHTSGQHRNSRWIDYLNRRGVVQDVRVDKSYVWQRAEMFAEDYRMCFRNRYDERPRHMNPDLPELDVVAWRRWFNTTWRGLA